MGQPGLWPRRYGLWKAKKLYRPMFVGRLGKGFSRVVAHLELQMSISRSEAMDGEEDAECPVLPPRSRRT